MDPKARLVLPINRSGRAIAVARVVCASSFWLALWFDPSQPVRAPNVGYWVLALYALHAAVLLGIAWRSWWWDAKLAGPAWLLDLTVFLVAVYFTEDTASSFTSPYTGFFVVLVLSALVRWGWRPVLTAIPLVAILYLLDGGWLRHQGIEVDLQRYMRRIIYMTLIPLVLVWFASTRGVRRPPPIEPSPARHPAATDTAIDAALSYAVQQLGAAQAVIVWQDFDEPLAAFARWDGRGCDWIGSEAKASEAMQAMPTDGAAMLFSLSRQRSLAILQGQVKLNSRAAQCPLAELTMLDEGMTFPFKSAARCGRIVLAGIPGMCFDDVITANFVRLEIEGFLDRQSIAQLQEREAVRQIRQSIARDLHDGIAQSLAGAAFRLQGLGNALQQGQDCLSELNETRLALRSEQQNVRQLIARLEADIHATDQVELRGEIAKWLPTIAATWGIDVDLAPGNEELPGGARIAHNLRQVLQEAVANAVRHGQATRVLISLAKTGRRYRLAVADNGRGFPAGTQPSPRSISERVRLLGGDFVACSSARGATLTIDFAPEVSA